MTSLMTSVGHKVGQIFKWPYLHKYFSYSDDQNIKISKILMDILLVYSTPVLFLVKILSRPQHGGHFENFVILNAA